MKQPLTSATANDASKADLPADNTESIKKQRTLPDWVYGVVGIASALVAWHIIATFFWETRALPAPTEVWTAFQVELTSPVFWSALQDTLFIALRAFLAAIGVGVVVGIIAGRFSLLDSALRFPIDFLRPIPPIVILPIAVMIFGPTASMADFLIFYGCVFPILYQTISGVRETDPVTIDSGRSYGLSTIDILVFIVLPSALGFIVSAIRIAAPIALIVIITAGLVGGGPGLGQELYFAMSSANEPRLFALVIVLGGLGVLLQWVVSRFERIILHWHPSQRTEKE